MPREKSRHRRRPGPAASAAAAVAMAFLAATIAPSVPGSPAYAATVHGDDASAATPAGSSTPPTKPYKIPAVPVVQLTPADPFTVQHNRLGLNIPSLRGANRKSPPGAAPTTGNGIPLPALHAYQRAAASVAGTQPGCQLPWYLLAGIGLVESDHGRFGGDILLRSGVSRHRILGPVLNGRGGFGAISDTDHGRIDGNKIWDRAVGPMQFIPQTWAQWGADGNGDGRADPFNIYDAALAAARYLCASGLDVATPDGERVAVLSYNHSEEYLILVSAFADAYRQGIWPSVPYAQLAALHAQEQARQHHHTRTHRATRAHRHRARHRPRRAHHRPVVRHPQRHPHHRPRHPITAPHKPHHPHKPHRPTHRPHRPTHKPPVTSTKNVVLTGLLSQCTGGWCVGGTSAGALDSLSTGKDLDGDCTIEPMAAELAGLVAEGKKVSVQAAQTLVGGKVTATVPTALTVIRPQVCTPPSDPTSPPPTSPTP
ncbi:MAG: lytic transglycosylase domain-containing protein [Nocardioidaceae bacterium]